MTSERASEQKRIAAWFDAVYASKGDAYLRPAKAYLVFLELLEARPRHRLLDVACGSGVMLRAAAGYTPQLYGADVSAVAVAQAKRALPSAQIVRANAERLPYADASFDLVTCLGSLERMLDVVRALAELRRVGRTSARYCFLVRNSNTLAWRYLALFAARRRAESHAGARRLEQWSQLFESSGFRVTDVLPDQYPLHRRHVWKSCFMRGADFRWPIATTARLDRANEFVFLLRRQP